MKAMTDLMWESFSARYSNAQHEELGLFPKLKSAWEEWQVAFTAGADAVLAQQDEATPVSRNEEAGPPDCPDRGDN